MKRAVVCVATTERYQRGMKRLQEAIIAIDHMKYEWLMYDSLPESWPPHSVIPYGFKAYALMRAADAGADLVLWADACILPVRSLEPLWERIERDGYWICRNGWTNYEWTADSAYPDLFPDFWRFNPNQLEPVIKYAQQLNRTIPHVVATSFGLNLKSDIGKAFLDEYFRLASQTRAFCGPWVNARKGVGGNPPQVAPCGPDDVLGHRHDQSCASVIAWRLGMKLTDPPEIFSYPPGDERTILLADGSYE